MTYVEWLRARNLLRIVAIILGALVLLAVILRISVARYASPESLIARMASQPGTQESHVTLPDGTKRMILYDPADRTHIVVDDHGYAGRHIVITEPSSRAHEEHEHVSVGSIHVYESRNGATTTTVIDTNGAVPMLYYMTLADIVALIVATILAAPLAREIDGHLEITLTKPFSRTRYAFGVIGVDAVAVLAASVMTVLAFYICQLLFETPKLDFSGVNSHAVMMGVALPLAWYALLCAATTWINRGYGAVLGFAWPVALLIGGLALIPPNNIVALFIHDVSWVLSRLSPLTYVSWSSHPDSSTYEDSIFFWRLSAEVLLFVVYSALAIWRWRRVEA